MSEYLDKTASLTPKAREVIVNKATERPHSGQYTELTQHGTYLCRRCGLALFRSQNQFHSGCGWPSFDESIIQAVKQIPDVDGKRTEIICERCHAHLGHVFVGEYLTLKNLRHCVNAVSLDFVLDSQVLDSEEAIIAGGCFWGLDHFLRLLPGVLTIEVGYCGGHLQNPSYEQVCQGNSGHYESLRVIFDRSKTNYYNILKRFFEIHDPTQPTGQGPDIGLQYRSAVFTYNDEQSEIAQSLIDRLQNKGYEIITRLLDVHPFWPAENYHQNYYAKNSKLPYCHYPVPRFD